MCGNAGFHLGTERGETQGGKIIIAQPSGAGIDDVSNLVSFCFSGEPEPRLVAGINGLIALVATEDEIDGREQILLPQHIDHVDTGWREHSASMSRYPGSASTA